MIDTAKALFVSIGITAFVLLVFGAVKGYLAGSKVTILSLVMAASQTLAVGALAAGAAYGIVRGMDSMYQTNVQPSG
jgi:vacuolar iron transporter family protein